MDKKSSHSLHMGNRSGTSATEPEESNPNSIAELKEALSRSILRFKKVILPFPPELDIHMSELFILRDISENSSGDSALISNLHNNLFISKPAVSQMLGSLEKKGYICRETCLNDRRKIMLTLTPKGREVMNDMNLHVSKVLDELITKFGEENTSELIGLFSSFADISEEIKDKYCGV